MTATAVRNWLGFYVLCLTCFMGGYSFLAPRTILQLEPSDRNSAFEIVLPLLVAQLSMVYRFYTDDNAPAKDEIIQMPVWVVKGPPIFVTILIGIELLQFAVSGLNGSSPPSPETFKGLVTFCVALLNASTVLVITKYFRRASERRVPPPGGNLANAQSDPPQGDGQ